MKNVIVLVIFGVFLVGCRIENRDDTEQEKAELEVLIENLDTPWAIDFLPDGQMIFTERFGRVSIFDGTTRKTVAEFDVTEISESGLHGIAVDPEFEKSKYVYVYYADKKEKNIVNKVSRFILRNNTFENEYVLVDDIPSAPFHDGGRIKFGPDDKLYITTGDATEPSLAQDLNSLAGKILRINKDGSIPQDNPFNNYVYSYGHRNPQGLAWHHTGKLISSEHGPTQNDEINVIEKGQNYGWPNDCTAPTDEATQPIRCYTEFTLAPSGIAMSGNELYIAGLRGAQVRKITLNKELNSIFKEEKFINNLGRIRDVVLHEGSLYIATSNRDGRGIPRINDDKIVKVKVL